MYESDYARRMGDAKQPPPPQHWDVLEQAFRIFMERNADRGDAWKDAGYKGQLVEMRKKLDRLWAAWRLDREPTTKDLDEAVDLINAVVFYIICARENNANGKWPWP